MAGLVPAIHALLAEAQQKKTWMPATSAGMTVEGWFDHIGTCSSSGKFNELSRNRDDVVIRASALLPLGVRRQAIEQLDDVRRIANRSGDEPNQREYSRDAPG